MSDPLARNLVVATSADGVTWAMGVVDAFGRTGYNPQIGGFEGNLVVEYTACSHPRETLGDCLREFDVVRMARKIGGTWVKDVVYNDPVHKEAGELRMVMTSAGPVIAFKAAEIRRVMLTRGSPRR